MAQAEIRQELQMLSTVTFKWLSSRWIEHCGAISGIGLYGIGSPGGVRRGEAVLVESW